MNRTSRWPQLAALKAPVLAMILAHVPPLMLYSWARMNGSIPDSEVVNCVRNLTNHGVWYGEPQGFMLFSFVLAQLFLIPATLFYSVISASLKKSFSTLTIGLLLVCVQVLAFRFVTEIYAWTFD